MISWKAIREGKTRKIEKPRTKGKAQTACNCFNEVIRGGKEDKDTQFDGCSWVTFKRNAKETKERLKIKDRRRAIKKARMNI